MDKHIFSRWQVALTALFVLANGLYLPVTGTGWLALLCGAVIAAAALFLLLRLPDSLLDGACALLSILLMVQTAARLYRFWRYVEMPAALAVSLLFVTAYFLARRGADCLFMWSFPVMVTAGVLLVLSVAVTAPDWDMGFLSAPDPAAFPQEVLRVLPGFLTVLLPAHLAGDGKAPAKGLLLGGGLLALLSLRALLLLGGGGYAYPVYAAAGLAAVGDFLKRCEVVFAAVLVLCECARVAVCFAYLRLGNPRRGRSHVSK